MFRQLTKYTKNGTFKNELIHCSQQTATTQQQQQHTDEPIDHEPGDLVKQSKDVTLSGVPCTIFPVAGKGACLFIVFVVGLLYAIFIHDMVMYPNKMNILLIAYLM